MSATVKRGPLLEVPGIDLSRLARLAFGRAPDHPLHSEAEVKKMIAALPVDPAAALAELAHQAVSIKQTESFDSGHRARILMALDVAAHDSWDRICREYFAPNGVPSEGREVGGLAFRSLLDAATELADCHASSLRDRALTSDWVKKNIGQIMLRRALWLGRKFVLMNMLHHPNAGAIWEDAHALCLQAHQHGVLEATQRALPGDEAATSLMQEYARLLMMEIAGMDTLSGREIELAFRIAGRVAPSAQVRSKPAPGALYAVVPLGASKPVSVRRMDKSVAALYLDTSGCLPQLKALVARALSCTPAQPDPIFRQFTMRESCDMAGRLLEYWGANPPKRCSQRVAIDVPVRLRCGFDDIVQAMTPLEQGASLVAEGAKALSNRPEKASAAAAAKAVRETDAHLVDASAAGLGVLVPRNQAVWARLGTLIAIYMEPGPDWIVGTVRRINAEGENLRLGVRILGRKARRGWFHRRTSSRSTQDHSHEERADKDFMEFYRQGIMLGADPDSATAWEILVPHGVLELASRLELPLQYKVQHLTLTSCDTSTGFDRVAFEVSAETPYPVKATKDQDEPDPWKGAQ